MTAFRYRAATAGGGLRTGTTHGRSVQDAFEQLRREGLRPIDAVAVVSAPASRTRRLSGRFLSKVFGELAVMLEAGITLDRALSVAASTSEDRRGRTVLAAVQVRVREGAPLSQALALADGAFPPLAPAMCAAGEADGRPAQALAKLAETLQRAQALKETLVSAAVYPALLVMIAFGVIGLMLFWVVPQFESLFSEGDQHLPIMTEVVLGASRIARQDGAGIGFVVLLAGAGLWRAAAIPRVRRIWDRRSLQLPGFGRLLTKSELARFFRVLGSLAEGGVALPDALAIARRSLINQHLASAVEAVTKGLREGAELTEPLAATGVLPPLAVSYLRTGEESAQLPLMLTRLADVLDRDVRNGVERGIAILTPLITVVLGALVATVIASIMSAILGFNDLALSR